MTATERQGSGWRTDVDAAFRGSATYRSLGEQKLSPAEERFEKGRRTVGLFLAPAVTVVFALLPLDMENQQQLLAAVLLGVIALAGRRGDIRHLVLSAFAAVLAFVALGKVLSPQFMIWLAPFAAVCAAWRLWVPAWLCSLAFAATLVEFPGRYFDLVAEENGVVLIVALRTLLLVAALIATLAALARSPRPAAAPRTGSGRPSATGRPRTSRSGRRSGRPAT